MDEEMVDMMDIDSEGETDEWGVEDYGHLVSSNAESSFLCSSTFMTPGSDQLSLESCMSFTMGALLGAFVVLCLPSTHGVPEFSKQDMVDCLPITTEGTTYELGYNYVLWCGLHMEADYPYVNDYGVCKCSEIRGRPKYSISGFTFTRSREDVLNALRHHPVTAGIYLYESFRLHRTPYRSREDLLGVYHCGWGEVPLRYPNGRCMAHAILVVGYGFDEFGDLYFIIKNWWGLQWGVNGYALVAAELLFWFDFGFPSGIRVIPISRKRKRKDSDLILISRSYQVHHAAKKLRMA